MVSTDREGYKSLAYDKIVALLVDAVKEQQKTIMEQQKTIGEQQKAIEGLKERIEKLESRGL